MEAQFGNTSTHFADARLNNDSLTLTRLVPVEIACSGPLQGRCNPLTGVCECEYSFIGPACQYHCLRSPAHGNQVCGGIARGNCTWNDTLALAGTWCHPHFPQCRDPNHKSFGVRCECRSDTRGPSCSIDCPKDPLGRVCSNNGTCDISGKCICNHMVEGSYCQYGMLNDTYTLRTTPTGLTPRRFTAAATMSWLWTGWDDEAERDVPYWEAKGMMFGGVGAPAQRPETPMSPQQNLTPLTPDPGGSTIMNVDPITNIPFAEVVTQQFTFQEIWYWNHTGRDSFDQYYAHPHEGETAPEWRKGPFRCYNMLRGERLIDNCNELALRYYIPPKRSGHSLITLGDQSAVTTATPCLVLFATPLPCVAPVDLRS